MGLFDRVERKLDRVINGAFARAFKAEVQPVEIAAAMRRAMDERAAVVGKGRTMVPNVFTIELDPSDYERLTMYEDVLSSELLASVEEHVESQRYLTNGPLHVDFVRMDDLNTGVFRVRPSSAAHVPERRRPVGRRPSGAPRRDEAPVHRPRNLPHPPEAVAPADGAVGMAGHAATAAAGAAAGTAAAGRAGDYMARHEAVDDRQAREARERAGAEHGERPSPRDIEHDRRRAEGGEAGYDATDAARQEQQRRDRAAWGDEGAAPAGHVNPPRQPMRIYGEDESDLGWDEPWRSGPSAREPQPHERPGQSVRDHQVWQDDSGRTEVHRAAPPPLPDPAHRPWLELDGDTYPLLAAITVLGRDSAADITLDDPGVSRRHAEIRVTHDGPHLVMGLRDLGSTNGTYVNGERIASQRLSDGDRVTVGRVSFIVRTRRG